MMTIPMGAAASKVAHVEPECVQLNAKKPLNPKTQTPEGCLIVLTGLRYSLNVGAVIRKN
jgi:hypothetical protein